MQTKNGMCRFCGQNRIVEVPNNFTQEETDEEVTLVCPCEGAKAYREKKEKEEKTEEQKLSAMGTTFELFHEDFPEVEQLMNSIIPLLVTGKMKKVNIDTGTKTKASISIKDGTIKVERTKKNVYSRETELA